MYTYLATACVSTAKVAAAVADEVLRTMTDVPFAVGEEFASKWQFLPYLERGLTQFARLDICNVGGFTEAMKVASLCETHYIDLMPHNPCAFLSSRPPELSDGPEPHGPRG